MSTYPISTIITWTGLFFCNIITIVIKHAVNHTYNISFFSINTDMFSLFLGLLSGLIWSLSLIADSIYFYQVAQMCRLIWISAVRFNPRWTWRPISRCVLRCATSSVYYLLHPEEASWRNVDVIK